MTTLKYLVGIVHRVGEDSKMPCEAKTAQPTEIKNEVSIVPFGNLGTMLGHPRTSSPKEIFPPGRDEKCLHFQELDTHRLDTTTTEPIENPQSLNPKAKIERLKNYMWSFAIIDYGKLDLGAASIAISMLAGNEYFKRTKEGFSLHHTLCDLAGSPFLASSEPPLLRDAFEKYAEYSREL